MLLWHISDKYACAAHVDPTIIVRHATSWCDALLIKYYCFSV